MDRNTATAYPLAWPDAWPRSKRRERSRFDVTFANARCDLATELDRFGARYPLLSTNVELRLDGQPYANRAEPSDPGVAVYFEHNGKQKVFACDKWDRVKDNMRAITKTIEAFRGIDRWGAGQMLERAFTAFDALPAPMASGYIKPWWEVLGCSEHAPIPVRKAAYREAAKAAHPDNGGNHELMADVNRAKGEAW